MHCVTKRGLANASIEIRIRVARSGGLATSKDKKHMADIGRKGGTTVSKNKNHMSKIGRLGVLARKNKNDKK